MINRNSFQKKGPMPHYILEVRFSDEIWSRVVRVARIRKTTFSWVVRYCLFRLIKRRKPLKYILNVTIRESLKSNENENFESVWESAIRQKKCKRFHRHRLCLYGEDELFIRVIAGILNCTMTHLVRFSVEKSLSFLEKMLLHPISRFHQIMFYWLGIKLFQDVEIPISNTQFTAINFDRFSDIDYW